MVTNEDEDVQGEKDLDTISTILDKQEVTMDEMVKLIGYGYVFRKSPIYNIKNKTLYMTIINILTEDLASIRMHVEPKDKKKILTKIKKEMREKWGQVMYKKKLHKKRSTEDYYNDIDEDDESDEGATSTEKNEKSVFKGYEAIKQLDKTYSAQLIKYMESQEWMARILNRIGMRALFMVMQMAKIPPHEWYEKISQYSDDPDEFLKFAEEYLVALFEAYEDAEALIEMRERYKLKDAEAELWKIRYAKAIKSLKDNVQDLRTLMGMLNKSQMEKFMLYLALKSAANAVYDEGEGMRVEGEKDGQGRVPDDGGEP